MALILETTFDTVTEIKKPEFSDSGFNGFATTIDKTDNSIVAEPKFSYKAQFAMEKKIPPHSRRPHSFKYDPVYYSLKAKIKHLWQIIIDHAVYEPTYHNDHGLEIQLQVGQFCTTDIELAKLCGKDFHDYNDVNRGIKKLVTCGFLRYEVRRKKTLITITHKETYDLLIDQYEARIEAKLRQERGKIEAEKNNIRSKEVKKNISNTSYSHIAHELLQFFIESLKKHLPQVTKFPIERDASHFDKLLEHHTSEVIKQVITFAHTDEFWRDKIFLPRNLVVGSKQNPDRFAQLLTKQQIQKQMAQKPSFQQNKTDRRTKNIDGTPVESPVDGRF